MSDAVRHPAPLVRLEGVSKSYGTGPNQLRWLTSIAGVGKIVPLKVARARRVLDVSVTLGELPEASAAETTP